MPHRNIRVNLHPNEDADLTRTEKTICLAVSPSLKALGVPGRPRLFEVVQKVKEINAARLRAYRQKFRNYSLSFTSSSHDAKALEADPSLELSYIVVPPRMNYYMKVSSNIYGIYLKYVAPEDILVYSIDEVFIDAVNERNVHSGRYCQNERNKPPRSSNRVKAQEG